MKNKKYLLIVLLLFVIFGCACKKEAITKVKNVDEFDALIQKENALLYDIRSKDECSLGHIPYFMCMGSDDKLTESEITELAENIMIIYSEKSDLNKTIIFIGDENDILLVFKQLEKNGYKNLYYFDGGYSEYAKQKGADFVPAIGCDC